MIVMKKWAVLGVSVAPSSDRQFTCLHMHIKYTIISDVNDSL